MLSVHEGGVEKYVPRIAVWHYEVFWVMANGDPKGPSLNYSLQIQMMDSYILKLSKTALFSLSKQDDCKTMLIIKNYSKICVKRSLKNRQNIDLNDNW